MTTRAVVPFLLVALPAVAGAQVVPSDVGAVEDTDGAISQVAMVPDLYLQRAACAFHARRGDAFDALFVFHLAPLDLFSNAQQGIPVVQDEEGIGRPAGDDSAAYCSKARRLRQAVKLGSLESYPDDPDGVYPGIPGFTLSGVETLAHEFGHHWMASVTFDRGDGAGPHCALRGYQFSGLLPPKLCDGGAPGGFNQHWSYWFDSGGVMYGNRIEDLGGGQFRTRNDGLKYGPLDQYLMGIRAAEEVGPLFLVDVGTLQGSGAFPAAGGVDEVFQGVRVDFTVEDVIRAVGPRKPFPDRCHWKAAMVAVHPKGKPPTAAQLDKLVRYANAFDVFYAKATDGRGSIDLTIDGRGEGTPGCPAGGVAPAPEPGVEAVPDVAVGPIPDSASDAAGEVAPDPAGRSGSGGCGAGPVPASMVAVALALLAAVYRRAQRPIQ